MTTTNATIYRPDRELYKEIYGYDLAETTASRWRRRGRCGRKLRSILLNGVYHTTESWLRAFIEGDDSAAPPVDEVVPKGRSPKAREAAIARAIKECEAAGV